MNSLWNNLNLNATTHDRRGMIDLPLPYQIVRLLGRFFACIPFMLFLLYKPCLFHFHLLFFIDREKCCFFPLMCENFSFFFGHVRQF